MTLENQRGTGNSINSKLVIKQLLDDPYDMKISIYNLTWKRGANPARTSRGHLRHLRVHFFAITKLFLPKPKTSALGRSYFSFVRQLLKSSSLDTVNETSQDCPNERIKSRRGPQYIPGLLWRV